MKLVSFDDHGPLSEDDAIIFREKPNPILYGIEAARVPLLFMVCLNIAQGLILHMTRGASIVFLVKLTLSLDCILFGLFIFVLMLIALGAEFILTDEDAIIRVGIYARFIGPFRSKMSQASRCGPTANNMEVFIWSDARLAEESRVVGRLTSRQATRRSGSRCPRAGPHWLDFTDSGISTRSQI